MDKPLRQTQDAEAAFWKAHGRVFNNSDPGTGKTRSTLEGFSRFGNGRLLAIAPLSILRPSWGADINEFFPGMTWSVAHGTPKKRADAFKSNSDVVLMNHDGVNWLAANRQYLKGLSHLAIDEYTAFKNRTSNRSESARVVASEIEFMSELSGTPNSNTITDIWHPAFLLDQGQRLGSQFFRFRSQVCTSEQVGPDPKMVKWHDKPGAVAQVASLLADITIRHELTGVPENVMYNLYVDMPAQIMAQYRELERTAVLEVQAGLITAVNAGIKAKKILQLLSGAVYDATGNVVKVHSNRHELVNDLILARDQCVVAFNWKHERDGLIALARKTNISFGVIDGSVSLAEREHVVKEFQAGRLKVIYAHPQSAAHGLTLTAGTTTIWPSPTYNAEHFKQFNRRIHRTGQQMKTETICICANGTKEQEVYARQNEKLFNMDDLLSIFATNTALENAA